MRVPADIRAQLRHNAVALLSLVIALSTLLYNGWRNETSEIQRNLRAAGFSVVEHLGMLQSVSHAMAYGSPGEQDWIDGWGEVLAIESLAQLLPEPVPTEAAQLKRVWTSEVEVLSSGDPAAAQAADTRLSAQIDRTEQAVLRMLRELD